MEVIFSPHQLKLVNYDFDPVRYEFDKSLKDKHIKVITAESILDYLKTSSREDEVIRKCMLIDSLALEGIMSIKQWMTLPGLEIEYIDVEKHSIPLHIMKFSGEFSIDEVEDERLSKDCCDKKDFQISYEEDTIILTNISSTSAGTLSKLILEKTPKYIVLKYDNPVDILVKIIKKEVFEIEDYYKDYILWNFFSHPVYIKFFMQSLGYAEVYDKTHVWRRV